jgi:hypothetical protein
VSAPGAPSWSRVCTPRMQGGLAAPSRPSVPTTSAVDPLSKEDDDGSQVHDRSTSPHVYGCAVAVPRSSTPWVRPSAAIRRHNSPAGFT